MKLNQHLLLCTAGLFALTLISCQKQQTTESNIQIQQVADGPNPWTNLNWNNSRENFQFVVVTDRTGGNRPGVFEQGMEKLNLLQPEFVMSVGDLIQGYTEDLEALNREWDEFDQFVDGLEMPFFYVPGNHDITNKVMEELWAQRYGRTYYHFVYQNVLFLCLNSEEPIPEAGNPGGTYHTGDFYLSEQQRTYIQETLEQHQEVRWTFVFWHKPVWLYEESDNQARKDEIVNSGWPQVESMLQGRKHTVFAGHVHRYAYRKRNNSDYITLATTGGGSALAGPIFGQFDHVLWVTMTDDGPVMANLMLDGIFDKDFQKDDIENNLFLSMQNKVLRVDSEFESGKPADKQMLKLTIFNHLDNPAEVTIQLSNREFISYADSLLTTTISPNSVSTREVKLIVKVGSDSVSQDMFAREVSRHYARWKLTSDFEQYGQVEVNGNTRLFQ